MIVDGDQGDASTCKLSKRCVYCEVRQVWMAFSMSLHLAAVDLGCNARQRLRQKRDAEKDCRYFRNGGTHKLLRRTHARIEVETCGSGLDCIASQALRKSDAQPSWPYQYQASGFS